METFKTQKDGQLVTLEVHPDRLEWTVRRPFGGARDGQTIPMRSIVSVRSYRTGLMWQMVEVQTPAGPVAFRFDRKSGPLAEQAIRARLLAV